MNEEEATRMLEFLGERVPVGPAPVDVTLEQGKGDSRRRRAIQVISAAAAVALVAVGAFVIVQPSIGGSGNLTTQPTTSPSGQIVLTEEDLRGQWHVLGELSEKLESVGFPERSQILKFSQRDGKFWWKGNDACNRWGGQFEVGANGAFSTSENLSTAMGCSSPPVVVTVPEVMEDATRVRLASGQLQFFDKGDSLLATFEPYAPSLAPTPPGTTSATTKPPVLSEPPKVTCLGKHVTSATLDYIQGLNSTLSVDDVIREWVRHNKGGRTPYIWKHTVSGQNTTFLLRADGTAHTELNILRSKNGGWYLNTYTACPANLGR